LALVARIREERLRLVQVLLVVEGAPGLRYVVRAVRVYPARVELVEAVGRGGEDLVDVEGGLDRLAQLEVAGGSQARVDVDERLRGRQEIDQLELRVPLQPLRGRDGDVLHEVHLARLERRHPRARLPDDADGDGVEVRRLLPAQAVPAGGGRTR